MPVTRSEGRGRKMVSDQTPSSSEDTSTSTTGITTEASSALTATDATVTTDSNAASVAATLAPLVGLASGIEAPSAAAPSVAPSTATTLPIDAVFMKPPGTRGAEPPLTCPEVLMRSETTTVKRRLIDTGGLPEPCRPQGPSAPSKKGSSGRSSASRVKTQKIAKAREELLRLQVELATARLNALITEDSDEDEIPEDVSVCTKRNERVDDWLEKQNPQPILAITNEPHLSEDLPNKRTTDEHCQPAATMQRTPAGVSEEHHQSPSTTPAGAQDFKTLAEAITLAVRSGQRSKYMDLPVFSGLHQEWLPFRAAYYETEEMYTGVENTNRLRRNLKGKAKEAVEGLLITNGHPSEIMKTLENRFGRPEAIAMMQMEALRGLPRLTESPRDICIYATKISNIVATLKTLKCVNYMYNPEVSKTIVDKLTPTLRYRFFDFSAAEPKEDPDLIKLEKFMRREATLCSPYALPEQTPTQPSFVAPRRPQKVHNVTEKPYTPKCPACEEMGHAATECGRFKKMTENERWDIAKLKRLCFRCLKFRNSMHRCQTKPCGIDDCKKPHHKMLHYVKKAEKTEPEATEVITSTWTLKRKAFLKIMPIQVEGASGPIDTYALMDDGSTVTLIDEHLPQQIGAKGPVDPLRIQTISDVKTSEVASRRVTFTLKSHNGFAGKIQARTVRNLQVSYQSVLSEHLKGCKHLREIEDQLTYDNVKPRVLIGQDNWHLLLASKVKKGNKDQPVASLTPLGWVLHGSLMKPKACSTDFVSHVIEESEDRIESLVKQYFEMDAICLNPRRPKSDPEEQALRILENNTRKTEDDRYETSLLWRKEDYSLPDNYENSVKRLHNIEKKLDRDEELKAKYTEQMTALIKKGYAEPAPPQATLGKTWYLPHFAVVNPMKPEKLRVVHDAAAKTKGVSLNDMLLKGPDLLQSLPGVVMKFRQHAIAVTADIKEMFMQVKLREQDRDALRYLWRGDRRDDKPPEEFRMTSLIFGASSSPSTAIYVKDLNAKQYEATHPEAALAIRSKHYVDDYLDSFETLEDAIRIAKDVRDVHKRASFELKQWKSNSPSLLAALGEQERKEDIELYTSEETTERVLGVIWKITTDELTFNLNLTRVEPKLLEGETPTKREALKTVMSLFDPLGFASPVTIKAKQLLQEVWRRGTDWDADIEEDLAEEWKVWITHLQRLRDVTIPRRYLHYSNATELQLHIFTDASESAYSTVLYWRAVTPNGETAVSLIMAKAKVAPLKLTSIPRLELQAAVMGTRLAEAVTEAHERKPDNRTFWTDSRTVLTWIRTGSRSYKPFVAHRLAAIEESTKVNEWRWVPTKLNVADDATRDVPIEFNKHHRWYKGPDFLYEDENLWPTETPTTKTEEESSEEKVHLIQVRRKTKLSESLPEVSRFSDWTRLRFATARVLQFLQLCQRPTEKVNYRRTIRNKEADPIWNQSSEKKIVKKITPSTRSNKFIPLTADLIRRAEELLMRASQEQAFATEIEELRYDKPVNSESRLRHLSIELINGVIKLRSRIRAVAEVGEQITSPMILDGNHPTVKLWIRAVHRELHHAGVETTVNECRQHYWVLRLRPITRTVIRACLFCRMKTQTPPYPRTGDLPACRLAHHKRPFTYTGIDYFGPLSVAVGRTRQKRYVAIFTCLTTRAVHLEIAGSLTSDSAIMALRRMIARRGCPTEIWSDNGTNLKAADKELREAIAGMEQEASKKTISWRYIPPGAPFMGGAWERLVRSVKTALTATLHEKCPTEEVLTTLLSEAEYTVNSRPLTHVSVSAEDPEALTPNHFLLGGQGRVPLPGTFTDRDETSRSKWRAAQRLADVFWTRWLREYLPELQHRREPHGRGPAVKVNDLVQVVDPNSPRNIWVRGRVTATYPGPDDVVRTVDIRTKGGILRRPVRKLVVLPVNMDNAPAPTEDAKTSHGGRDVRDSSATGENHMN